MELVRTMAFIDGFNLYHAIAELSNNHLKWLNLRSLCEHFAPRHQYDLRRILYFTAFATWKAGPYKRHRAYVKALEAVGVESVIAKFKEKRRECRNCGNSWIHREEKETDVGIGVNLVDAAYTDEFDRALLVTADSDLVPAVRVVRHRFPEKTIRVLTPPARRPSHELLHVSGSPGSVIQRIHLERSLLPETITATDGSIITRPSEYHP